MNRSRVFAEASLAVAMIAADIDHPTLVLPTCGDQMERQQVRLTTGQMDGVSVRQLMPSSVHLSTSWGNQAARKSQAQVALVGIASHVLDLRVAQSALVSISQSFKGRRRTLNTHASNAISCRKSGLSIQNIADEVAVSSPSQLFDIRCKCNPAATRLLQISSIAHVLKARSVFFSETGGPLHAAALAWSKLPSKMLGGGKDFELADGRPTHEHCLLAVELSHSLHELGMHGEAGTVLASVGRTDDRLSMDSAWPCASDPKLRSSFDCAS